MHVFYFGIVALTSILGSHAQEPCITHFDTPGSCISIHDCGSIFNLLRQFIVRSLSDSEIATLRRSQCGFERDVPKVCCPQGNEMPGEGRTGKMSKSAMMVPPGPPDVTKHPNLKLINQNICGPISQSKIIKGNKTTVLQYPWMALLAYKSRQGAKVFKCGGTVINKRYILTAAHCVTKMDSGIELIGVRIGEHDISKERDCFIEDGVEIACADKYQEFSIGSIHFHREYNKKKRLNDIALIKLDRDANFKANNVKPICLPVGDAATLELPTGFVTGWGRTESGLSSNDLLSVQLDIVSNDRCAEIYKQDRTEISYKHLCAGGTSRLDSCGGDSGGPLQCPTTFGDAGPKFVQYGIVGFGPNVCGTIGYPGVYTRVVYYMDWILDTIDE